MSESNDIVAEEAQAERDNVIKFTIEEVPIAQVSIKVIGVGGCGGNIVDYMIESGIEGVDFIALNTDEQSLNGSNAPSKFQLGRRVTQGYGTGSDPAVGREAALENTEDLAEMLGEADLVFLVVGLGGGTGTGAAPVVASLAKQMNALTLAAAVKPFNFEGKRRTQVADEGLDALREQVDTVFVVPNERLLEKVDSGTGFFDGFRVADRVVVETLTGITDIITKPGIMNSDFADMRSVLTDAGMAVVGSAERSGRDAAAQAAREAIAGPMMEHEDISRANRILVNITGSAQFGMHDASEALQLIHHAISSDAKLIIGTVRDDSMGDKVRVMLVASGFAEESFALESPETPVAMEMPLDAPEAESPWQSETSVELLDTETAEQQPQEIATADTAEATVDPMANAWSFSDEDETQAAPRNQPVEFMPPPNIRDDDQEETEEDLDKPSFLRRALFR